MADDSLREVIEAIAKALVDNPEEVQVKGAVVAVLQGVEREAFIAAHNAARKEVGVEPVAWSVVERTLAHLRPLVASAVRVLWFTGMRPGEAVSMKLEDIDRSGAVWVYRRGRHKTRHRGKKRAVA